MADISVPPLPETYGALAEAAARAVADTAPLGELWSEIVHHFGPERRRLIAADVASLGGRAATAERLSEGLAQNVEHARAALAEYLVRLRHIAEYAPQIDEMRTRPSARI